jgi:hypothetical protein
MDPAALLAWDGRLVNCTSESACAEASGGRALQLLVTCNWMNDLPDGTADGSYCTCSIFRVGEDCREVQPALQVRGAFAVPVALLAGLAAWRGVRDFLESPNELRTSPPAVCSAVNICAALSWTVCSFGLAVTRITGGSAALNAVVNVSQLATFCLSYMVLVLMALVFECVRASARQSKVHHTRWYAGAALLLAAMGAAIAAAKLRSHLNILVAVAVLVVGGLWLRATVVLANTLDEFSSLSPPIAERARETRRLIGFAARSLVVMMICQVENAMVSVTVRSHPALIFVTWLLDWAFWMALANVFYRIQEFVGAPLRKATKRLSKRSIHGLQKRSSSVRPSRSAERHSTAQPTNAPSSAPSSSPTAQPINAPGSAPSNAPTAQPTNIQHGLVEGSTAFSL